MCTIEQVAPHEAGHVVVAASFGLNVGDVSIDPSDRFMLAVPTQVPREAVACSVAGFLGEVG